MCGVIGLLYEQPRDDLGRIAGELLKTLEYRGYDSTGAAIQRADGTITLAKGVGAPTVMVDKLGITSMSGQILCGQVRWATFGAVDEANAQPHEVRCKVHLFGAHNGNVTNCDALKLWLQSEGHTVKSDNDGEMVVHAIEHLFAGQLVGLSEGERTDPGARRLAMRAAIVAAQSRLEGSYAAVIVDPPTRTVWAIKAGSSLYCGLGTDERGCRFGIASSDLSSVLKLTRVVLPMVEGEFVEMTTEGHQLYRVVATAGERHPDKVERQPVRSRLRAADIALLPPFETFMDQEIAAQEGTVREVVTLFQGGTEITRRLTPALVATGPEQLSDIRARLDVLRDQYADDALRQGLHALVDAPAFRALLAAVPDDLRVDDQVQAPDMLAEKLVSAERGFLADLIAMARDADDRFAVRLLDSILEREDEQDFAAAVDAFVGQWLASLGRGGRVYITCCGTSLHAARAAAVFFNEIACVDVVAVLPGEFRGQHARSLHDGDLLIAVSQSGETKDLIDVMNDVIASGLDIARVSLVNNVNSTLAQEKSDVVIPLRCGPEIAVPATKSFMNQVAVFYALAIRLGQARAESGGLPAQRARQMADDCRQRWEKLHHLPGLLRATFQSTDAEIEAAAQMLYLRPSIHLLATRISAVAREGALKIREVVLNHAEGFEGSEFKHGPNTILGKNTVMGPTQVRALLQQVGLTVDRMLALAHQRGLSMSSVRRLTQAITDTVFAPDSTFTLESVEEDVLKQVLDREVLIDSMDEDYPLIFITGPDERDVLLTVSQINTHKIRGALTVVIAEEHPALRAAASKAPADNPNYRHVYIPLPRTGDTLMAVFSATLVLQRLALKMSLMKAAYLTRLGFKDHGVHPDVPKNVSKSITVD